jgi:hypothetical protein
VFAHAPGERFCKVKDISKTATGRNSSRRRNQPESAVAFVVTLRAKHGRDPIKELRRLLKILGRAHGFVCLSAEQEHGP